jgi:hypothetical protein
LLKVPIKESAGSNDKTSDKQATDVNRNVISTVRSHFLTLRQRRQNFRKDKRRRADRFEGASSSPYRHAALLTLHDDINKPGISRSVPRVSSSI